MNGGLLEAGTVTSDADLTQQQVAVSRLSGKLSWLSSEVVFQSVAATLISVGVFVGMKITGGVPVVGIGRSIAALQSTVVFWLLSR